MQFKSLDGHYKTSFEHAVFSGVAPDGNLYIPDVIPVLPKNFFQALPELSLKDLAYAVLSLFLDEIPQAELTAIIEKTFSFSIPLHSLTKNIFLLELFHGPTLAFKDIGARFLAEVLAYYLTKNPKKLTIIVATSGDTGSAVAQAFHHVANIDVFILYPKNKISVLQEKQMTTLGGNIHAIEIEGNFDDCQVLVKQALVDEDLKKTHEISTANSINIGRLLPQIVYYFWAIACLERKGLSNPMLIVPSGNFGNVTAGAYAKAMGAPFKTILAATNSNDVIPRYLNTGILSHQASKKTLSNAMDVAYPNNFIRLQALYNNDYQQIKKNIVSVSVSDEETLKEIADTYKNAQYLLDPHTAVGVSAAKKLLPKDEPIIVAATAHPSKFPDVIQESLGFIPELPPQLSALNNRAMVKETLPANYQALKRYLSKIP